MQSPRARKSRQVAPKAHDALIALARLLARQAAREHTGEALPKGNDQSSLHPTAPK